MFSVAVLSWALAASTVAPPAVADWHDLPIGHDWFGVYLQGKKVGYLEAVREKKTGPNGPYLHESQRLLAHIAGMGQNVEVEVLNEQDFAWKDGRLLRLTFRQTSPTGAVEVSGSEVGKKLEVTFTAGGETRQLSNQSEETVQQAEASTLLAMSKTAKVGDKVAVKTFDPSIQKVIGVEHELSKIEDRVLDGVVSHIRHIMSRIPELNIEEEEIYSPDGHALESKVAGLFTIRLEDEQRAKDVGYSQDVLVAFVVPVDHPVDDPGDVNRLQVTFSGAGNYALPQTERQKSTTEGDALHVVVERHRADPATAARLPFSAREFADTLKPEPLLQSDAPEIRRLAKEIVGTEKNSYKAAQLLLDWVYTHVEKAYVPAVSNALEVYRSRKGDCGEHTVLFTALARAAGIPARPVVGITYWPPGNGFGFHAWSEIYVGRWIAVDPTQGSMSADATHVQLAGGDLAEQARITGIIGKLKASIENVER